MFMLRKISQEIRQEIFQQKDLMDQIKAILIIVSAILICSNGQHLSSHGVSGYIGHGHNVGYPAHVPIMAPLAYPYSTMSMTAYPYGVPMISQPIISLPLASPVIVQPVSIAAPIMSSVVYGAPHTGFIYRRH